MSAQTAKIHGRDAAQAGRLHDRAAPQIRGAASRRALGRHDRIDDALKTATTVYVRTDIAALRGDTAITLDARISEGATSQVITGVVFKGKPHKINDNGRIREIRLKTAPS